MKTSILTTALLDPFGKDYVLGGNERYLLDIIEVYKDCGFTEIEIIQPSLRDFQINDDSNNIKINGISFEKINMASYLKLNKIFYNMSPDASINHYQSFTLGFPKIKSKSIAISHGISWDKPYGSNWETNYKKKEKLSRDFKKAILLKRYRKTLNNLDAIVANDTNFINFTRVQWPEIANKVDFVPNYVDLNEFSSQKNEESEFRNLITILFPRRISSARGFEVALSVAERMVQENSNIRFIFTGEKPSVVKKTNSIIFQSINFNEMHKIYNKADIVIIPTVNSEGTSLSCLEAMASGVAVIASNVGGLTNIIIDGYNGKLINPNEIELENAIKDLITFPKKRNELKNNALRTVKVFSKDKWRESWRKIIENQIKGK